MTKRKHQPSRLYSTFSSSDSSSQPPESPTSYRSTGGSDKARSAAAEARRLGSMGSWGDRLSGGTPTTDLTPDASTVHGDDDDDDDREPRLQYRRQPGEADPLDPPPLYTPAETPSAASSPLIMRAMIDDDPDHYQPQQRVSVAPNTTSPLLSTHQQYPSERQSLGSSSDEDDDQIEHAHNIDEFDDPYSASLPEPVQHSRRHHRRTSSGTAAHSHVGSESHFNSWKRKGRGCVSHRRRHAHHHGPPYSHEGRKARAQRFKRSCCFILSLLACLWLLIPGLCKSYADNSGNTEVPTSGTTKPPGTSFPPPSREYHQHETYQSISGTYKLYDLLDLSTTAGSISITVDVQPGDQPARLRLATTAGSINVRVVQSSGGWRWLNWLQPDNKNSTDDQTKNFNRTFVTDLSSKAGSVGGNIIHGNGGTTSVSTLAGSINLSIYTAGVSGSDPVSKLTTNTNSGSQHISIVGPEFTSTTGRASIPAVRAIQALHRTTGSGSIHLKYPSAWEGQLYIDQKGSGSISATGTGLEIERRSRHDLLGWKGNNSGDAQSIEIRELGSGSIHFEVA